MKNKLSMHVYAFTIVGHIAHKFIIVRLLERIAIVIVQSIQYTSTVNQDLTCRGIICKLDSKLKFIF